MRLIDADELLKWISGQSKSPSCPKNESAFGLRIMKHIDRMPSVQPDIIHCKDCKYWMPYDWMFSEVWQSKNMDDYPEKEIGCQYCDMNMSANDFCSRSERRTDVDVIT